MLSVKVAEGLWQVPLDPLDQRRRFELGKQPPGAVRKVRFVSIVFRGQGGDNLRFGFALGEVAPDGSPPYC